MTEDNSLEGWNPVLSEELTIDQVVDLAFDYRGNTTIVKADGTTVEGYIFNRDSNVSEPYLEYFAASGDGPFSLPYSQIVNIDFTGKDTAAGKSWEAWLKRKEEAKVRAAQRREQNP